MAALGALGEAAAELVEIHGQHEHRALVTAGGPARRARRLCAGTDLEGRGHGPACAARLRALDGALAGSRGRAPQQRAREADVLRYQIEEIDAAGLADPDEDALLLRAEEDRLADAPVRYREAAARGAVDLPRPDASGEGW